MTHWSRIVFDLVVLSLLFTLQQILTSSLVQPFQQAGFYCNDYSVNHVFKSSTVTNLHLILISLVAPIVILLLIELIRSIYLYLHNKQSLKSSNSITSFKLNLCGRKQIKIPQQIGNLYIVIGYFLFGLLATNLITNCGKLLIGRLRPNFLSVCKPNVTNPYVDLCQSLVKTYLIPDIDFKCLQTDLKDLQDARKSFPSGHSSLSFYSMVFLALVLHHMCTGFRLFGNLLFRFLQVLFVASAFVVGLSRVTDNKHHPTDVLAGSLIGVICAFVTYYCLIKTVFKNYKFESSTNENEHKELNVENNQTRV